ncbi:glycosyltransferase [Thioclava electrotropha]|uniref:Glycosyltransferase n=1 Tax=Thioclava electrotropha TaxID=1549850 RepID=A0ABX6YR42_9RHOB|nr:glycosyltransferase [Thioclava electrotropha]QPZ90002.1 glycosyltransferase [Thioclava electrotropha]
MRTSEGYVARSLLTRIDPGERVILVTRRNNVAELRANPEFRAAANVRLVGYDLPRWAAWWKKGPRGYGLYAYLWQVTWPLVLKRRRWLTRRLAIVHTFNFHNDSIPSLGWVLGRPSIWGPVNHNEGVPLWRTRDWPARLRRKTAIKARLRQLAWRLDPLLYLAKARTGLVFSAGSWVDSRLRLAGRKNVRRRSQLGLDPSILPPPTIRAPGGLRLVSGGRLDWIKGLDLALEALALLPESASLTIIGDGPCRGALGRRAENLGVAKRVTFHPAVPRDELLRAYLNHDLFVFPSAEAGGLAWVEALAIGLPVAGFEGPTELADMAAHLPGIHIAPARSTREANVAAFAQTIAAAIASQGDSAGRAAAARAHYGWDGFADEIQTAYRAFRGAPQ